MAPGASALVLFTRVPVPGRAKTRLLPALGAEGCANLQRSMALDQVERLSSLGLPLTVCYADDAADMPGGAAFTRSFIDEAAAAAGGGAPVRFAPQEGAGLGARMARALEGELAAGAPLAVLMGSDLPLVTAGLFAQALEGFGGSEADVLLCPSEDGGYWCVGLREPFPELFGQREYGTDSVFEGALRVCRGHGRSVALGPTARDVDVPGDLAWLAGLARAADPRVGARTARALRCFAQGPEVCSF